MKPIATKAAFSKPVMPKARSHKPAGSKRFARAMRDNFEAVKARGALGYVARYSRVGHGGYRMWNVVAEQVVLGAFESRYEAAAYLRAWRIRNGYDEHGLPK